MVINIVWLKYVPFILVGIAFIYATYKIIMTDTLLDFVKKSLCGEDGKPSGRSIAGFVCINSLVVGFFVSMYYAKDHCAPEWYVWCLAALVSSFYGLKEIGKFAKGSGTTAEVLTTPPPAPVTPPPVVQKPEQKQNEEIG